MSEKVTTLPYIAPRRRRRSEPSRFVVKTNYYLASHPSFPKPYMTSKIDLKTVQFMVKNGFSLLLIKDSAFI